MSQFSKVGKYSYDIFLYHFFFVIILRNTVFIWWEYSLENIWIRRILVLFVAIILPMVFRGLFDKAKRKVFEQANCKEQIKHE